MSIHTLLADLDQDNDGKVQDVDIRNLIFCDFENPKADVKLYTEVKNLDKLRSTVEGARAPTTSPCSARNLAAGRAVSSLFLPTKLRESTCHVPWASAGRLRPTASASCAFGTALRCSALCNTNLGWYWNVAARKASPSEALFLIIAAKGSPNLAPNHPPKG